MNKWWWKPKFKLKIGNGYLMFYKLDYPWIFDDKRFNWYLLRPFFFYERYYDWLNIFFELFNFRIEYKNDLDDDYECSFCLCDPADCCKDIRRNEASKEIIECYNDSHKI